MVVNILFFFPHQTLLYGFRTLRIYHISHMDYFYSAILVFFFSLIHLIHIGKEKCEHSSKFLFLCCSEKSFKVNNYNFHFWVNYSFRLNHKTARTFNEQKYILFTQIHRPYLLSILVYDIRHSFPASKHYIHIQNRYE